MVVTDSNSLSSKKDKSEEKKSNVIDLPHKKIPTSWQDVVDPPFPSQHPHGPYNSSYSYDEIRLGIESSKLSKDEQDIISAFLDLQQPNGRLTPSDKKLAKHANISIKRVRKAMASLKEKGIIETRYYFPNGEILEDVFGVPK